MSGRDWRIGMLVVVWAALGWLSVADATERVALVIGNSRYDHAPYLNNPERDAQAIAAALSKLGFQLDFSHFHGAQKSASSDHEAFAPTKERCPWECCLLNRPGFRGGSLV